MRPLAFAAIAAGVTVLAKTTVQNNVTWTTRACQPPYDQFPFCDTTLSIDARVKDIISRIKDEDAPPQLTARHSGGGNPGPFSNVSYIGLPDWDWGLNCIHGVQSSCVKANDGSGTIYCPTSFPNPVNYGMTWNRSLFFDLGAIIATETRALWLAGATEESSWSGMPRIGLDCWSPNININRDPRWGRNQEVPGEDPLLNGDYGMQYTMGIQTGEDPDHIKVAVTLKHWDAYSLEDSDGFTRHNFNAIVSNYTLADTYFPAFKQAVTQGGAMGVMCSYNSVNGQPTCANDFLKSVMRDEWNFTGYITSDTGAVEDIYQEHKYVKTEEEAACVAIRNGTTDVCSGFPYHDSLLKGIQEGICAHSDMEAALYRTFSLRFQLGLFDPPQQQPYWNVPLTEVGTPANQGNNLLATLSSMTLLKNDGNTLPIPTGSKIAVIGPHSNATSALVGSYLGQLCDDDSLNCITSPFQAITSMNAGGSVVMEEGTDGLTSNSTAGFAKAVAAAQASDYVILFLGIDETLEGETHDRTSIDLPYIQHQLASTIAAVGKPTAVVLLNGGMLDVSQEANNAAIGAILEAGYPGQFGAQAIAMTLFGTNDHLGGKLPYTIYPSAYTQQIMMSEMEMDVGPGRSYRYYTGPTVYPFAYGLSLTTFSVANVTAPVGDAAIVTASAFDHKLAAAAGGTGDDKRVLAYVVNVTNTGTRTGDEVVFAFMYPQHDTITSPAVRANALIKQLVDYQRVHLAPGQSTTVNLQVSAASLRLAAKPSGDLVSVSGQFIISITNGVDQVTNHTVTVVGDEVVAVPFPGSRAK